MQISPNEVFPCMNTTPSNIIYFTDLLSHLQVNATIFFSMANKSHLTEQQEANRLTLRNSIML